MVKVFKPDNSSILDLLRQPKDFTPVWVFLGGSIEMGAADFWQDKVISYLQEEFGQDTEVHVYILNPRRDNWDSSWVQSKDNELFREQVEWELSSLTAADVTLFYFDPNTKSPVTLLELGSKAADNSTIVYCPEGYFRKGNVDIFCEYNAIEAVDTWEEMLEALKIEIKIAHGY